MTKVSQLPQDSAPSGTDYTIALDTETGQVKKILLSDLVTLVGNSLATTYATKRTKIFDEVVATTVSIGTSWADVTGWTGGSITTSGGDVIFHLNFTYWRQTSGVYSDFRLVIDGTTYAPSSTGFRQYTNELSSHKMISRSLLVTGLSAGTHTVKLQAQAVSSGVTNFSNPDDWINLVAVEYLH